jgi:hypothetical protein
MIDTVVHDTLSADQRRDKLWRSLDMAYELRQWVTMFSREHHRDLHANVLRWVETRRQRGWAIRLSDERIIGVDTVTTVLTVERVDFAHEPFLSVHFPPAPMPTTQQIVPPRSNQ